MKLGKRLLTLSPVEALLVRLAALYLRLVARTTRWEVATDPATERLLEAGTPVIFAFWHGRLTFVAAAAPRHWRRTSVLISQHRDGRFISDTVARLGVGTILGSSHRGGGPAMIEMRERLQRGECIIITPDGPRGPRMRAKSGAIKLAQVTGVPLLPVSASVAGRVLLGSWDRLCLALPFRRGVIRWGKPMLLPRLIEDSELEAQRLALEEELNRLTLEADRAVGLEAVEPAPPAAERLSQNQQGHAGA